MIASVAGTTILSLAVARSRNSNWPDHEIEVPAGSFTFSATARCMSRTAELRSRPRMSTYTQPESRAFSLFSDGPPMLKSENARLSGWVYVDIRGRDLSSAVRDMQRAVAEKVKLPAGTSISWSGQFEFLERATARLKIVVPATLAIIFVLLYFAFRRAAEALLIMATLPFALVGGFWLMYVLGYDMSIASAVGFIALAGVAAEIGVVMLVYVNQAVTEREAAGGLRGEGDFAQAIVEGAALRVRPVAMTVAVIIAGLLPIVFGSGTGSEVMRRIASPMVGGMITAPLLSMFVLPVAYLLLRRPRAAAAAQAAQTNQLQGGAST